MISAFTNESAGFAFPPDSNHDGILQALEIVQADVNLRVLDVSGDGVLTRDELQPRR